MFRDRLCAVLLGSILVVAGCATTAEEDADLPASLEPHAKAVETDAPAPGPAAGTAADPGLDSTLDECVAFAARNSPRLRSAFDAWRAALERVPQAGALPDPRFTFAWYIQSVETRVGPQRSRYALAQSFPWFGTLSLREDVAALAARGLREDLERIRREMVRDVEVAWADLYELERSIEIVRENVKLLEYWEGVVRGRFAASRANHADLLRVQVEQGRAEDRLRGLVDRRRPLAARMNAVLGRPADAPVPAPRTLPPVPAAEAAETLVSRLVRENPTLRAVDAEVRRHEKAEELAEKGFWPDVTLGLGAIETGSARMPGVDESGKDPIVASISVTLPVWRDKLHAAVREARSRRRAARERRADLENRLRADLERAQFDVRDAERRIDLYRDTLVPKSRQWLETATAAYQTGNASVESLVDAWSSLLEFRLAEEMARAARARGRAEIIRLVGEDARPEGSGS